MELFTDRLHLRRWREEDAGRLYALAQSPNIGPRAGWPPHGSAAESLEVIRRALSGSECYAICLKEDDRPIGSIELKLRGATDMTDRDDECELGYWLGEAYWGRGLVPEAARGLLRRAFDTLGMRAVWCGYFDGNTQSKRVQEKLGFLYHHSCDAVPVPLLHEVRVGHTNLMTRERWRELASDPK